MRMPGVLPRGAAIAVVVCAVLVGPAIYVDALAQMSDPHSNVPADARADTRFLSWLAGEPVGLQLRDTDGQRAGVQSVQPGSAADHAGLRRGDILVHVGDLSAPSSRQAAEHINNAWAAGKSAIDLVVSRAGQDFYVVLRLHR